MTKVFPVKPEPGIGSLLIGADFIDAYRVRGACVGLDAGRAARLMLAEPPPWVDALMALRNALVTPLGLKTGPGPDDHRDRIGIFPIELSTPDRMVLGFDDRHLDFRLIVDVARAEAAREVTATTLVRLHNLQGRAYLMAIRPFHKLIARSMLSRVARKERRDTFPG